MILIGLAGKARSGKDTVAEHLAQQWRFKTTAFAKPIKDGCKAMFGLTDEHVYGSLKEKIIPEYGCSPRQILQRCGTEFGREMVHTNIWLMQVERQWHEMKACAVETFHSGLIVSDVRFENEAERIRGLGGIMIHVDRPNVVQIAAHLSEAGVAAKDSDYFIVNDGTLDDLYDKTDKLAMDALRLLKT